MNDGATDHSPTNHDPADHSPIVHTFMVGCRPDHAFRTWTERIDAWWPTDHRLTGAPTATMRFEDPPDGRLVERSADGHEVEWGRILAWEPPGRLLFEWTVGQGPDVATEVEVTFDLNSTGSTNVRIEHRGWERFSNDELAMRKPLNRVNWSGCLGAYRRFIDPTAPAVSSATR